MSSYKTSRNNTQLSLDSEFIGFINSLNESIKEFYNVAKYNTKETNAFLDLLEPQWDSIASLLNSISTSDKDENIGKIFEIIIQCKSIVNQLRNNSNLNLNNLTLFFDDAKILFKRMRIKRNESLKAIRHSITSKKNKSNYNNDNYVKNSVTLNNYTLKDNNYLTDRRNSQKLENNRLFSLIKQLKDYDEIIGKFSLKAKNNFINLQKMILNNLNEEDLNSGNKKPYLNSEILGFNNSFSKNNNNNNINTFELKTKYEKEINKLNLKIKELEKNNENFVLIWNKAKKFDELNQKLQTELIKGNNDNINLLKDVDLERRILNLIDTNKNLNLEIRKLKNGINNLDLRNIQLKQDLLGKERDILLLQNESEDKTSIESIIKLKKDMQNLYKENNLLKEKLRNININNINIKANINKNNIDTLNIKIEELSKLLTNKMKQIIFLEKENITLKNLLSDTASSSSNTNNKKFNLQNNKINNINVPNNISKLEQMKLSQENKKYKNSLIQLSKENQELKAQLQNLEINNNYILPLQQELNQLKKIIDENNLNNNNKNSNYEEKINNLQNILNEKEALINKYEQYNNNDKNKLIEEIKNKDTIISELKNKLMNNEKQILSLNQILKKNNENNNNTPNINSKELELVKNENKNLEYNINKLNQEITQLTNINAKNKKEQDNMKQAYNELVTQNVLLNKKNSELLQQINSNTNQNLNKEDLSNQIKKKQEEIDGLNTFIQKLSKECEKYREDLENNQAKTNSLQKENASIKKQLERLAVEMPKELNALKTQLDDANKKLAEANININNTNNKSSVLNNKTKSKEKEKEKSNKTFDDGMQPEKYNNILSKLNQEISDLKNKNKELLFKLEDKEVKSQNSRYKTEDLNMSGYEEEFDLRKMATGARDKNRSEDINIDYPGIQGFKDKLKEYKFRIDNLEEQIKILLSKIKITNSIKPTFVQICQLLGYSSNLIEKMTSSEKEKKKILGV
mgnify:CR=1 FL=1